MRICFVSSGLSLTIGTNHPFSFVCIYQADKLLYKQNDGYCMTCALGFVLLFLYSLIILLNGCFIGVSSDSKICRNQVSIESLFGMFHFHFHSLSYNLLLTFDVACFSLNPCFDDIYNYPARTKNRQAKRKSGVLTLLFFIGMFLFLQLSASSINF